MRARPGLFGLLLLTQTIGAAALPPSQPVTPSEAALPTVRGPIVTTARSWPFASTEHSVTRRDLRQVGYEEQEYFISGTARVYEWPAVDRLETFARGRYTTRILVRRPKDPAKFSGTVIVEALNPSLRYDAAIMWIESQDYFLEHGDVYVGVTIKPVAIQSLQRFDPQRYAAFSGHPLDEARIAALGAEGMVEATPDGRLRVTRAGFPVLDAVVADLAA